MTGSCCPSYQKVRVTDGYGWIIQVNIEVDQEDFGSLWHVSKFLFDPSRLISATHSANIGWPLSVRNLHCLILLKSTGHLDMFHGGWCLFCMNWPDFRFCIIRMIFVLSQLSSASNLHHLGFIILVFGSVLMASSCRGRWQFPNIPKDCFATSRLFNHLQRIPWTIQDLRFSLQLYLLGGIQNLVFLPARLFASLRVYLIDEIVRTDHKIVSIISISSSSDKATASWIYFSLHASTRAAISESPSAESATLYTAAPCSPKVTVIPLPILQLAPVSNECQNISGIGKKYGTVTGDLKNRYNFRAGALWDTKISFKDWKPSSGTGREIEPSEWFSASAELAPSFPPIVE